MIENKPHAAKRHDKPSRHDSNQIESDVAKSKYNEVRKYLSEKENEFKAISNRLNIELNKERAEKNALLLYIKSSVDK